LIPTSKTTLTLDSRVLLIIFSLGIMTALAVIVGAIWLVGYLLNLTISVYVEIAQHLAAIYLHADPFTQLLMFCIIGYILVRVARSMYRSFLHK
jgi:hypothetical protein